MKIINILAFTIIALFQTSLVEASANNDCIATNSNNKFVIGSTKLTLDKLNYQDTLDAEDIIILSAQEQIQEPNLVSSLTLDLLALEEIYSKTEAVGGQGILPSLQWDTNAKKVLVTTNVLRSCSISE